MLIFIVTIFSCHTDSHLIRDAFESNALRIVEILHVEKIFRGERRRTYVVLTKRNQMVFKAEYELCNYSVATGRSMATRAA